MLSPEEKVPLEGTHQMADKRWYSFRWTELQGQEYGFLYSGFGDTPEESQLELEKNIMGTDLA